jgi:hypothetical protein
MKIAVRAVECYGLRFLVAQDICNFFGIPFAKSLFNFVPKDAKFWHRIKTDDGEEDMFFIHENFLIPAYHKLSSIKDDTSCNVEDKEP